VIWRFSREHHHVDYRPFESNKLIKKPRIKTYKGVDNYGMYLDEEPLERSKNRLMLFKHIVKGK